MSAPAIELRGVSKVYGAFTALESIDLAVAPGEFVALVGGSGSGKTTLLKTINGLVHPDAGGVSVAGEEIAGLAPHLLRRRIGYVFQEVGLFPHLTVAENIAITPRLLGWDAARLTQRVTELLTLVALSGDVARRSPSELSGGQRQRVGVARALAAQPTLMLMDEPFGALDPITRDSLGGDYRAVHDRLGLTTIMVTHDIAEAVLLSDRVLVLAGRPLRVLAEVRPPFGKERDLDAIRVAAEFARMEAELRQTLRQGSPARAGVEGAAA